MSKLNTKEMAKHLRSRIKAAGIPANVCMAKGGSAVVVVSSKSYEKQFSEDEQKQIAFIAKCNNLTYVRGIAIDPEITCHPNQFNFHL